VKGQAAIMDALIFMLIASGAATLLLFVSSVYSSSTNDQIMTIYNYEYAGNALIALHYAKDSENRWFWNELKAKLLTGDYQELEDYFSGDAKMVWKNITNSSPAGENTFICFTGAGLAKDCYPDIDVPDSTTVYSSSVKITPTKTVILKLFY
jgi:hypothetical protein